MSPIPLTVAGAEKLRAELHEMKTVQRPAVIAAIAEARSHGDLSENAEYHQAREAQAMLEDRIGEINRILKDAEIVSKKKTDTAGIGCEVEVKKKGDTKSKTYTLVGEGEANMSVGKISYQSPLGEALFGAKKGDSVTFKSPAGPIEYKIIDIK